MEQELIMKKAKQRSVVEFVTNQITDMVREGRFKVGDKLPNEFEIMDELNVSRGSLREAMKMLSAIGVVEIRRGDGTYICNKIEPTFLDFAIYSMIFSASTQETVVELRQSVDEMVLALAMKKCTQEDIDFLKNHINEMRACFIHNQTERAAELDMQFHKYLAECTQNPFIIKIVQSVYMLFENSIKQNLRTHEMFAKADEHHQSIVACLEAGDPSKVHEVVSECLSIWKDVAKEEK